MTPLLTDREIERLIAENEALRLRLDEATKSANYWGMRALTAELAIMRQHTARQQGKEPTPPASADGE